MGMILLWGDFDDPPMRAVSNSLSEKNNADIVIIDQQRLIETDIELSVSDCITGCIRVASNSYDLTDISSAYLRPYSWTSLCDVNETDPNKHEKYRHGTKIERALIGWSEITTALVVNRFSSMASNGSKPYQASIIKKFGFKTPATVISTTPEVVKEFYELHGDVIYKSISGVRSIVSRLTPEKMKQIEDVIWAPTQFQQYVEGKDIRVHVIDDKTICSEIISNADDYRYAKSTGKDVEIFACDIPDECKNQCIDLVREMGLVVGGVDLRLTPDGEWYCFEVNPSPGFSYYQSHTGQDISGEIADLLIKGQCENLNNGPTLDSNKVLKKNLHNHLFLEKREYSHLLMKE